VAPRTLIRAAAFLVSGALGTVAVHAARDLPWRLAAIVGLAIGVLVVSTLRTGAHLRSAWRRRPDD
jgi:hypothetical protein